MEKDKVLKILDFCIENNNFSCAFIQKSFNLSYPQAGRFLDLCVDLNILSKTLKINTQTVQEYKQDPNSIIKKLEEKI